MLLAPHHFIHRRYKFRATSRLSVIQYKEVLIGSLKTPALRQSYTLRGYMLLTVFNFFHADN